MSSLRPLTSVARAHELHVLCLKPCKRCGLPFEHCRVCEPGRLYCIECSPIAARERERKSHREYYRGSHEGRKQHHDEEHRRRKRRREERKAGEGGRDRRCGGLEGRLQVLPTAARIAAEEPSGDRADSAPVEWTLVAWPGLLAAAQRLLGTERACPFCKRTGRVARVIALEQWRRRRVPRGVG